MPTEEMFINEATSYSKVLELAETNHWDNQTVNLVVAGLLDQYRGKSKRTFAYGATLAASKPECAPTAVRSFVHTDWIDGESVVQAEETSLEEGFNLRFHRIEDDIDAMLGDIARLSGCLAGLRSELAARLDELRLEINRINTDIADCCYDSGPFTPIDPGIYTPYPWRYPYDRYYPSYPGGWTGPMPGTGGGVIGPPRPGGDPMPWEYNTNFGNNYRFGTGAPPRPDEFIRPWLVRGDNPLTFDETNIVRSAGDPDVAIIAGMQGRRIATDSFNGNQVEVWSTPIGVVMTPMGKVGADTKTAGWTNPHIEGAGAFRNWTMENAERISSTMERGGATIAELDKQFGDVRLANGVKVGAYLGQLPSGARVKGPAELGALVVNRAAANVLRDGARSETVIGLVGLNQAESTKAMEVSALAGIDETTSRAMRGLGIKSLDDLAAADTAKLAQKLADLPGSPGADQVGQWQAEAMVLGELMGPGRR